MAKGYSGSLGSTYIFYACNLIWWAVLGFQDVMTQQEIRRNREKKTNKLRKKKPKTQQKPPRFCGGFCWPFLSRKLFLFQILTMFVPTNRGYNHIYIYAVELKIRPKIALF